MAKPHADLLREIAAHIRQAGIAESTFGLRAVNDGKLVARLRDGGRIWPETVERVRSFMRQQNSQQAA